MSNDNGSAKRPPNAVGRKMARLAYSVATLAELQARLAKAELGNWCRSVVRPLLLLVAAALIVLASAPVLLLGLAWTLVELAGWSPALAMSIVSLACLAAAGVAASIGWCRLRGHSSAFLCSSDELRRNLAWIKHALKHESNSPGTPSETGRGTSAGTESAAPRGA
jgi:uncharacterized membrane protein YqjE